VINTNNGAVIAQVLYYAEVIMATIQAATEPVITEPIIDESMAEEDALFDEIDKFEKRGNWTEDRKEILKNLTGAEIDAEIMRLQAAHPERLTVKAYM